MLPETHPLIKTVTEPLAENAERRLAAQAFLEKNFDTNHPGIGAASVRIETARRGKAGILWTTALWVLAAVALAWAVSSNASTMRFMHAVYNYDIFEPWGKTGLPSGLSEEERLLLGDPEMETVEGKRKLHLLAPENPGYFAEYVQAHISKLNSFPEMEPLPPDFLETAARIAPDNAYFPYIAAGLIAERSFSKKNFTGPKSPPRFVDGVRLSPLPRESEYDITDSEAFQQALEFLEKATALPDFESHTSQMIIARTGLLPDDTLAEFTESLMHAFGTSAGIIQLRHVSDLLCARAEQLSKSDRKDEFLALARKRDAFLAHLGHNPDKVLVGELVYAVIAIGTATNFQFAADRLGFTELAETYRKQSESFRNDRDTRDIRAKNEDDPFPEERASLLTSLTFPMITRQVDEPPPFSEADFEPMRMAEHELLAGMGLLSIALLLPVAAAVVFLFRFVAPPMIRLTAKVMAGVLGAVDWLWIGTLGIALPVLSFLIVTRMTPLGGREYGASHFLLMFPGVHLLTLLLWLLIAPAIVVRWRLSRRLAPFRLSDRFTIPVSIAVLALIGLWSLAALPILVHFGKENFVFIALAGPPVFCLFMIFANALRSILGKPSVRLSQTMTTLAVLPVYPAAIIALCALMPIYSAGEKRWLAKETLIRINPDATDLGSYEFRIAAQKRKETNAILGLEN